ncbi:phasin family protein [Puniceicoccus vermicola]
MLGMFDLVKKAMFAGVGAAVITKDKVEKNLQEMVDKGKMTADEAKDLSSKIIEAGEKETEQARNEATRLFTDMLNRAQVVTQDQIESLEKRVRDLEGRWHREFPNDGES